MLERMVFYGQTGRCRWKVLLDNFCEADGFESCGTCDNCVRIASTFVAAEREAHATPAAEAVADAAAPVLERGESVSVPRYGHGFVDSVDAEGVAVVFAEGSRRIFLPTFVRRESTPRRRPSRAAKVTASAA
ncbi:MAG: RecQ family zinc-binding domain-containing protein [Caldimonas sp.]